MSELLTREDYATNAASLTLPVNSFVDGSFRPSHTGNSFGEEDISTPFGGYKQSGFGGRDNSLHAHDQYTELKTIWIDLSDRAKDEAVS